MKKSMKWLAIVSILLAIVMCFSLVACGDKDKDSDTDTNVGTDSDTDTGVPAGSFTVTFKQEGEADVVITVESGKTIDVPAPKAVAGYTVVWDQDLTGVAITQNVVVNAEKTPVENTISYILNGGSNSSSNPTKFTVEDAITFTGATRPGYDFVGWYSDAALTTPITGISKGTVTSVVNVYAKWQAASYSITYNTNNGTNPTTNPTSFNVESTGAIVGATKIGYEFLGWYLYSDFSGSVVDSLEDIASQGKAVTLYAKYRLERFTITYVNANGLSVTNNNAADFNKEETVTFVDPSRYGYTFEGWYSDAAFTNKITGIAAGTEGNQTVYAKWSTTKYTITYKYNDESKIVTAATNPSEYSIETNVELVAPTVVDGYEFVGWFIEGTANQVTAILPGEYNGNLVLEGRVQVETFDIDYHINGGTLPDNTVYSFTAENTGTNKITLPVLSRDGYTFNGWYTEAAFENSISEIDGSIKKDIAVYAKWTVITYTITYSGVPTDVTNNNPTEYSVENKVTFNSLEKDGFVFLGWYLDESFATKIENTENKYSNLTLYARLIETSDDPTITLTKENVKIEKTGGNTAGNVQDFIMDGETTGEGLWSGYSFTDWYNKNSVAGDMLTITLNDPMDIIGIKFYCKGNWVDFAVKAYNSQGEEIATSTHNVNNTDNCVEVIVLASDSGTVLSDVKTITLTCNTNGKIYRMAEVTLIAKNPAYVEPIA